MRFFLCLLMLSLWGAVSVADERPLVIHMISGAKEYDSQGSLKILQKHLEEKYRVAISASWVHDGATNLPNLDKIPEADLLVVYARRMKLPEEQMAVVRKHWESGKPVVGIRTASHAFTREENRHFDHKVLAGNYQGHYGNNDVKVSVVAEHAKHPVLQEVGKIVSKRLYKAGPLPDDVTVLQQGTEDKQHQTHPVTWVHEYQGGRVFYTSLGVQEDFRDEDFLQMITNAVFWTTKREAAKLQK